MSRPKKAVVRRKYQVKESAPQQENDLGERLDLKHIPRPRVKKSRLELLTRLLLVAVASSLSIYSVVKGFEFASATKDGQLAGFIIASSFTTLTVVTRHYFKYGVQNARKDREGSVPGYARFLEEVAKFHRRITGKGAD